MLSQGGMSKKPSFNVFEEASAPYIWEPDTERLYANWKIQLHKVIQDLKGLPDLTERQFLKVGSDLNAFYSMTLEVSDTSTAIVDSISGAKIEDVIEGLSSVLFQMENYLCEISKESEESVAALRAISEMMGHVTEKVLVLKNLSKTQRMLGISIRIQSTHLIGNEDSFDNVSDNIKNMSLLINAKSDDILEKSAGLDVIIKKATVKINNLEKIRQASARDTLNSIKSSIDALSSLHDSCLDMAGYISDETKKMSRDIGEIVASMQFHDITRQQIEHVCDALAEQYDKISEIGRRGIAPNYLSEEDKLISIGDVCELQAAQLCDGRDKFVSAVNNLMGSLKEISEGIRRITDKSCSKTGFAEDAGYSFISEIEDGISSVRASFLGSIELNRELLNVVNSVVATAAEFSSFIDDIENIGSEIKMIALNARIRAVLTGGDAAGLGVIAESIKQHSFDTGVQTNMLTEIFNDISASAEQLNRAVSTDSTENRRIEEKEDCELSSLLNVLHKTNDDVVIMSRKTSELSNTLSLNIASTLTGFDVEQVFLQNVNRNIVMLEQIVYESRKFMCDLSEFRSKSENLKAHVSRYTMHSERKVHFAVEKPYKDDASGPEKNKDDGKGHKPHGDFGDNIELF